MVQIQIDADEKLDMQVGIYRIKNRLDNKSEAVVAILKEYFKNKKED